MKYLFVVMALLLVIAAAPMQAQVYNDNNGYYGQRTNSGMSVDDQQRFDSYYAKWVDATRKGDQDDIAKNAGKMQEIMARYNIPSSVPYGQIASNSAQYGYPNQAGVPYGGQYVPNGPYAAARLTPEDQRNFDKDYSKWVDATHKGDQDDIQDNARKMQEIMARYNIPANTPFQAVATNSYAGAYPNTAYGPPYGQAQRLSAHDQKDFDKAYKKWVDARRKKDMDDVDNNARKMQQIMARYNIPANVPFDQIATQGAGYR